LCHRLGLSMLENLIVPVLNRYDLLQRMLDSVDYPVKHLLIIDNGASEVLEDMELHVPDCVEHTTYLPMPANLGVAASWNLGIKLFPYDDRWFIVSNDVQFQPNALERLSEAHTDEITVSSMFPHWQAFCAGYEAVKRVGLFDEGFFPAYFEDTDFQRRADRAGVLIVQTDVPMTHDNSSTIRSDDFLQQRNSNTYSNNQKHHSNKVANNDFTAGGWDVERRRRNGWERGR
jgi:GT2 family glycosyltransferase